MRLQEGYAGEIHYSCIDIVPPWISEPETIVFHHGVGASSDIWAEWIPVLADRYRLLRFDMRGTGRSLRALKGERLAFDELVDDVISVADAAGISAFHLVGESIGGTAALGVGLRHAQRIKTLTVCNAAYFGSEIRSVGDWSKTLEDEGGSAWSATMMERRFFPGSISPEKWAWYEAQQASHPAQSILAGLESLVGVDLREQLADLRTPTLLLHADSSPFISAELMASLHSRLHRSELQIFPRTRHGLPFSHARECAEVLRAFLQRQRDSGDSSGNECVVGKLRADQVNEG